MQRTFISSGPRSCLNANGSLPSRCPSDLTPRAFTRSFGKKIFKSQSAALLDPESRDRRLKDAANKALQDKYDRNTYNKRYRERRKEKFDAKKEKEEDKKTREVANIYRQALRQPAKDAMKAMKEDWALGALAPKRDTGDKTGKLGTLDMGLHQLTALTKVQKAEVKQRMGDNEFRVHDRVVVLKGRDRGKIGQILSIDEDKLSATIDGINKVAVYVPKYMTMHDSDPRSFRIMRRDVRMDEIKLVCSIRNPETQEVKEVILDRVDLKKVLVYSPGKTAEIEKGKGPLPTEDEAQPIMRDSDKAYELEDYKWKTIRYVPGTDTEIVDHTEKDAEHNPDAEYGPDDTLLISVEEQTYWPEVIEHPMPASVLKEISLKDPKTITKFSEHIEDSIREKAQAKMRKQLELEDRIRTPLQELKHELKKVQREALHARRAEFHGTVAAEVIEPPMEETREGVVEASEAVDKAHEKNKPQRVGKKSQPTSDIMAAIGQAMARNWAKNPSVATGSRRKLLERVLEQEGFAPVPPSPATVSSSEARV